MGALSQEQKQAMTEFQASVRHAIAGYDRALLREGLPIAARIQHMATALVGAVIGILSGSGAPDQDIETFIARAVKESVAKLHHSSAGPVA